MSWLLSPTRTTKYTNELVLKLLGETPWKFIAHLLQLGQGFKPSSPLRIQKGAEHVPLCVKKASIVSVYISTVEVACTPVCLLLFTVLLIIHLPCLFLNYLSFSVNSFFE